MTTLYKGAQVLVNKANIYISIPQYVSHRQPRRRSMVDLNLQPSPCLNVIKIQLAIPNMRALVTWCTPWILSYPFLSKKEKRICTSALTLELWGRRFLHPGRTSMLTDKLCTIVKSSRCIYLRPSDPYTLTLVSVAGLVISRFKDQYGGSLDKIWSM